MHSYELRVNHPVYDPPRYDSRVLLDELDAGGVAGGAGKAGIAGDEWEIQNHRERHLGTVVGDHVLT